jgi:2-keto-3-deoxy-L-fuconate dehydrogenase
VRLSGKRALVTAAGQGIGRAVAIAFAEQGAKVLATDINVDSLAAVQRTAPARIDVQRLDVTDRDAIEELVAANADRPCTVLFNCAGIVHAGSLLDCNVEELQFAWELNVLSMFRLCHAMLPGMIAAGGGSIINMSSVASSIKAVPNRCAYSTTKAAVIGLTKSLAVDFIDAGVRCNAICPGTVDTPSLAERVAAQARAQSTSVDEVRAQFAARQPMHRLGRPEEIAALAVYLASDESAFTTGAVHVVDGGWSN